MMNSQKGKGARQGVGAKEGMMSSASKGRTVRGSSDGAGATGRKNDRGGSSNGAGATGRKNDRGGSSNGAGATGRKNDRGGSSDGAGAKVGKTDGDGRTEGLVRLGSAFYDRASVVAVARDLLGKVLVTEFGGQRTSGRIVEVEAYNGVVDRASHAWSGRRTRRTEVMYSPGGIAYVYLIYGIHHLFNVVTNRRDVPHAVLVRALEPMDGIPVMLERMGKPKLDHSLTRGPGNLSRALGLMTVHTGTSLLGDLVWIGDDGFRVRRADIVATPRIGVDYAGADAALLYRFYVSGNPYVSGPKGMRK